ncbi:hypothetical protein ACMFMF_000018 [Clarireedia jacksonii]
MSPQYAENQLRYFRVPKDEKDKRFYARKYKALRLEALRAAPGSFSSTWESESGLSEEEWVGRLFGGGGGKEVFVCAVRGEGGGEEEGEWKWIAQVTMIGPKGKEEFRLPGLEADVEKGEEEDEDEELWQLSSLFTLPEYRGRGVGRGLCREAVEWVRNGRGCGGGEEEGRLMSEGRVRGRGGEGEGKGEGKEKRKVTVVKVGLAVKVNRGREVDSEGTVRLYRGLEFKEVGWCTLSEARRANREVVVENEKEKRNGDGDEDVVEEERNGLVMMLRLVKGA